MNLHQILHSEEMIRNYLEEKGVVKKEVICGCNSQMNRTNVSGRLIWKCKSCASTRSIYYGTIFEV